MTFGNPDDSSQGDVENQGDAATRELARAKAKALREQHRKQERRGRLLLKGGIAVVLLAIIAVVAVSILNTIRPPGPGPLNMISDGVQLGPDLKATRTAAIQPGDDPVPSVPTKTADAVSIQVYSDYLGTDSADFFSASNQEQMATWLDSGAATVEIHPISLLNSRSQGSQYSTRAANAVACVANYDPDSVFAYNVALLADQPGEATGGLTDEELVARAQSAGVGNLSSVRSCVTDIRFQNWVKESTDRALAGKLPYSDLDAVADPLTVLVNGVQFTGPFGDEQAFAALVVQAAGVQFNDETQATPTPTPVPVPTETPVPTDTPTDTATAATTETPAPSETATPAP